MVVRILDHVENCSTYADGDVIFNIIAPIIKRGDDVVLSFEGVEAVPSSFINASIVRLIEVVSLKEIKAHLQVVKSTRQINALIKGRIDFLSQSSRK
jgi:STAS-like domain of unknown function (DUF4325)